MTDIAPAEKAKRLLPLHDDSAPIVCTISEGDKAEHLARFERLRSGATEIERTGTGLLLHFPAGEAMEADVRRFAADEKRCCTFWGFAVVAGADEIVFRWDGPPSVDSYFELVERALRGDEPLDQIEGLL
jgi:hypothetical protein